MRYAGIYYNDISAAPGFGVSIYLQGCPHRCEGCFNPETWDFQGGKPLTTEVINDIYNKLDANGVHRNFSILGGEPLCAENLPVVEWLLHTLPLDNREVWLWTGYTFDELQEQGVIDKLIEWGITGIVDGRFEQSKKTYELPMRGSSNQNIIYLKK